MSEEKDTKSIDELIDLAKAYYGEMDVVPCYRCYSCEACAVCQDSVGIDESPADIEEFIKDAKKAKSLIDKIWYFCTFKWLRVSFYERKK